MSILLSSTVAVIGLSIPQSLDLSNCTQSFGERVVLKEYHSPTMIYDPWESYRDKKNQEILEKIFVEEIKNQIQ